MIKEFRDFILRGNVVDLAVGVIIGAAFGAVINSLVKDVLTPLLSVFGTPEFNTLSFKAGQATVNVGLFLNALISFLLVATAVFFFIVKPINALDKMRRAGQPAPEPTTKECPFCATEIPLAATRCPNCTSELG
ncbi:MAG: large conductance mechanosensitive channel protein MscL [Chloroflexota bacterium]